MWSLPRLLETPFDNIYKSYYCDSRKNNNQLLIYYFNAKLEILLAPLLTVTQETIKLSISITMQRGVTKIGLYNFNNDYNLVLYHSFSGRLRFAM